MDQKTIAWASYITIIGWIIALITYNNAVDKSSLARFHIRQSLGLMLTMAVISCISFFIAVALGLGLGFNILGVAVFILWVIGLVNAVNGQEKPVPVLGDFYQRTLTFIN